MPPTARLLPLLLLSPLAIAVSAGGQSEWLPGGVERADMPRLHSTMAAAATIATVDSVAA